jgi:hypothetical protein
MRRARREVLAVVIGILLPLVPGAARALPFTASVERFEADGNAYGSPGGALDLVDEFDDGVLGPNFALLLGTATESGGSLTLHDPGVSVPLTGLPQEISTVESTVDVGNGEGDFTLTSYWNPTPLGLNTQLFFQIYGVSPVIEASGFTVNNLDAATAASVGTPAGYSIGIEHVFPLGNQQPPVSSYVTIDPLTVTGQLVLRMSFDDATNMMTYSFSLDGGTTFQSPFAPLPAFVLSPEGEVLLGAAAIPTATPPPQCSAVIDPVRVKFQHYSFPPGEQRFRMRGNLLVGPNVPPILDPVTQGVLLYATTQYGHLALYQVPPGALGTGGCGLDDGWKLNGRTFTYVNRSGLLPPTCNVFSANARIKVQLRDDRAKRGRLRFAIIAREATFSNGSPTTAVAGIGLSDDGMGNPVCGYRLITCVPNGATANCR